MMIKVKPAPGLKVRDPKSLKCIPPSGLILKVITTYWARRIECKDVIVEEIESSEKVSNTTVSGGSES